MFEYFIKHHGCISMSLWSIITWVKIHVDVWRHLEIFVNFLFMLFFQYNRLMKVRPWHLILYIVWQSFKSFPLWKMRGNHDNYESIGGGLETIYIFLKQILFSLVIFILTSSDVLCKCNFASQISFVVNIFVIEYFHHSMKAFYLYMSILATL